MSNVIEQRAKEIIDRISTAARGRVEESVLKSIHYSIVQYMSTDPDARLYSAIPTYVRIYAPSGAPHAINVQAACRPDYDWPEFALRASNRPSRQEVYEAINEERAHQDAKYGADKQQSIPGFLLIIKKELEEAEDGWLRNSTGRHSVMAEICQIAATCVAAMEKYGTTGTATTTDDIPQG